MANASQVPDVTETDLERSDLEEAARELSLDDVDDLSDQELFERIGVALGEIDIDELEEAQQATDGAEDAADEAEDEAEDATDEAGDEAEDAGDEAEESAEDAGDEAEDQAEDAGDDAEESAEDAGDEAEDQAEDAVDDAEDQAEDAGDDAEESAEDAGDDAEDATDEEDDGGSEAEPGEYRFEDDPRDGIEPVLDLELGPVALDVLGVEIHVRRVHAVLAANPNGKRNVIGKALAALSTAAAAARSEDEGSSEEDGAEDADAGSDDDASEDGGDDDAGLLHTITAPARGLARGAKKVLGKD
jgi:hypothetical protein